jgi:hypothetical protein
MWLHQRKAALRPARKSQAGSWMCLDVYASYAAVSCSCCTRCLPLNACQITRPRKLKIRAVCKAGTKRTCIKQPFNIGNEPSSCYRPVNTLNTPQTLTFELNLCCCRCRIAAKLCLHHFFTTTHDNATIRAHSASAPHGAACRSRAASAAGPRLGGRTCLDQLLFLRRARTCCCCC